MDNVFISHKHVCKLKIKLLLVISEINLLVYKTKSIVIGIQILIIVIFITKLAVFI